MGVTKNRIFHFTNLKGYDRIYREIPIDKITYIENQWHDKNKILLAIGAILLLVGVITLFFFIGIVFLIAGIILIVKSMKQYGFLTINDENWSFRFYEREAIRQIEVFIENLYNLENLSNPTNGPGTSNSDPLYLTLDILNYCSLFLIFFFILVFYFIKNDDIIIFSYYKSFKSSHFFGTPQEWMIPERKIGRTVTELNPSHLMDN